jgi:N-acetylneuraminic acid mutarotase
MKNFSLRAGRFLTLALLLVGLGLSSCKKDDTTTTSTTGNWTVGNSFPGVTRSGAVSFVVNGIAYVGTGNDVSSTRLKDFYAFDPTKGSWTQLTPMPAAAPARYLAAAFAANNKGYVGTGYAQDGTYLSDFWQFDPATPTVTTVTNSDGTTTTTTTLGTWTRIKDFPLTTTGTGRRGAVAGSIGNVGYVGCGFGGNFEKDMYRYDAAANSWTDIGFPGNKRVNASAFTLNNVMYLGFGTNNNNTDTQFWAYDPAATTNPWTPKRSLANVSNSTDSYDYSGVARTQTAAFAVNNLGYIVAGNNGSALQTCYEYNPAADTWTLKNPFTGSSRSLPVAFGIGNIGYVGLGATGAQPFDDFWNFDPNAAQQ